MGRSMIQPSVRRELGQYQAGDVLRIRRAGVGRVDQVASVVLLVVVVFVPSSWPWAMLAAVLLGANAALYAVALTPDVLFVRVGPAMWRRYPRSLIAGARISTVTLFFVTRQRLEVQVQVDGSCRWIAVPCGGGRDDLHEVFRPLLAELTDETASSGPPDRR